MCVYSHLSVSVCHLIKDQSRSPVLPCFHRLLQSCTERMRNASSVWGRRSEKGPNPLVTILRSPKPWPGGRPTRPPSASSNRNSVVMYASRQGYEYVMPKAIIHCGIFGFSDFVRPFSARRPKKHHPCHFWFKWASTRRKLKSCYQKPLRSE